MQYQNREMEAPASPLGLPVVPLQSGVLSGDAVPSHRSVAARPGCRRGGLGGCAGGCADTGSHEQTGNVSLATDSRVTDSCGVVNEPRVPRSQNSVSFRNRITGGSLMVHRKHYQGVRSPL